MVQSAPEGDLARPAVILSTEPAFEPCDRVEELLDAADARPG